MDALASVSQNDPWRQLLDKAARLLQIMADAIHAASNDTRADNFAVLCLFKSRFPAGSFNADRIKAALPNA
ncbi:MAG TPA: hypothetical protein VGV18_09590, partial [Verrucomicrobiae bacterium]|nr:hypothetical protein [Verrucomicrobiae bacterium]